MKTTRLKERQLGERVRRYEGLAVSTGGRCGPVPLKAVVFAMSGEPGSVFVVLPLFPLGDIAVTAAADEAVSLAECLDALLRHVTGDFGDLEPWEAKANEQAIDEGERVFS